jgi:hypothetical protein
MTTNRQSELAISIVGRQSKVVNENQILGASLGCAQSGGLQRTDVLHVLIA